MQSDTLPTKSFATSRAWAAWIAKQPSDTSGVWLKLPKKGAIEPSVTKQQAIEVALCYGWIDGQIKSFDDAWFITRFTPRRAQSKWSHINKKTAERLCQEGKMQGAGLREIERAKADGRWGRAYKPQSKAAVPKDLAAALRANSKANAFFKTLDAANRYAILYRVHEAKRPETRAKRIEKFVAMLARGERIHET
jgi:uncharacterized protein YdeI (YjbR/CyaY-like superfamily)